MKVMQTKTKYKTYLVLVKKQKPFIGGEEIRKLCLEVFSKNCGDMKLSNKGTKPTLSKQTVIETLNASEKPKKLSKSCKFFFL